MMGQMRKGFAYQNPDAAIGEPQCHRFVGKDSNGFMPLAAAFTRNDFFLTRVAGDFEDEILCHFDGNGEIMETVSLGGKRMTCEQILYDGDLHLCGSESELLDKEGKVQYAWRNLDTDGEFCSLFRHRNGKHDLVFRTELYGYSVLEVESGQEMTISRPASTRRRRRKLRKYSSGPAPTITPALICWLSPAASGPVPAPPSCWTFPILSSPSPRSVGWICGTSLPQTIPGLTILSSSAGRTVL